MKISVSWLLEHIDCKSVSDLGTDLEHLMLKFNQRVAEIENFSFLNLNANKFFAGKVTAITEKHVSLKVPELKKEIVLSPRSDAKLDTIFLVVQDETKAFSWAQLEEIELKKDGLIPAVFIPEPELAGKWKTSVEWHDAILEVDNKSITHRPDMWSHRGFAREIALLCEKELIESQSLLSKLAIAWNQTEATKNTDALRGAVSVTNEADDGCKYFCAAKFENVENKPCIPKMLFRLARTGVRPINAVVDLTNYLTADWGQPVHAYDANEIPDGELIVRKAKPAETLTLLDGKAIELHRNDMVIANIHEAVALAGVMGGENSGITPSTDRIIFESANFSPSLIRHTAQRHKLRTESSARFEKTLHKNLALEGVLRFAALAQQFKINMQLKGSVVCVGKIDEPVIIAVDHSFLENKIGVALRESDVIKPLEALGFNVEIDHSDELLHYKIQVPDFRASKDIKIPEDIVEEVARSFGFEKISPKLPNFEKEPYDLSPRVSLHAAKNYLAYGAKMIEQCNYNFFNLDFIKKLGFAPEKTLSVKNPVNENTTQLVTSLIPGLLGNVVKNYHLSEELAFFECARVWEVLTDIEHSETATLSGIFWQKRTAVDFFKSKAVVQELFEIFGLNLAQVSWQKLRHTTLPWQHPFATARIEYQGKFLGLAGKINHTTWSNLDCLPGADGFFFELNLDFLKNYKAALVKAKPQPKTQDQSFDVAFIADGAVTCEEFKTALKQIDKNVKEIVLIDEFRKADWGDKRSLAFRVKLQGMDDEPLSRTELEKICQKAREVAFSMGAEIRG